MESVEEMRAWLARAARRENLRRRNGRRTGWDRRLDEVRAWRQAEFAAWVAEQETFRRRGST